jgi:hypothetical protein
VSFLSTAEVEAFLGRTTPALNEIALELRNIVCVACPRATERILWRGLWYHDEARGGPIKGGICQIEIHPARVRLAFVHGARLEDPDSLLHGDRLSKRYVDLTRYDGVPWESLRRLIQQAARLNPADFGLADAKRP